jgi:hypothetical protein
MFNDSGRAAAGTRAIGLKNAIVAEAWKHGAFLIRIIDFHSFSRFVVSQEQGFSCLAVECFHSHFLSILVWISGHNRSFSCLTWKSLSQEQIFENPQESQ